MKSAPKSAPESTRAGGGGAEDPSAHVDLGEHADWRLKEYGELCSDWRHRDGMLWQSLAVAITVTSLTLNLTVSGKDMPWLLRAGLFFLAFLLNFVVLLKIVKDNYYQHGSSDLMGKLRPAAALSGIGLGTGSPRIHRPAADYQDERIAVVRPAWLYKWLAKQSTFGFFFAVVVLLVTLTGIGFVFCLAAYAVQALGR
jgi:hypothetical protein